MQPPVAGRSGRLTRQPVSLGLITVRAIRALISGDQ